MLIDECFKNVKKDPTPVKDTWYTQGVSIISDRWSNFKHMHATYQCYNREFSWCEVYIFG